MGHRELAEEEAAAWTKLYPSQRKPYGDGIESYWREHAPERSGYEVSHRHTIWRTHNETLWGEVERGMPLGTATRLIAEARALKLSLEERIEQYKAGNTVAKTSDGRVIHKNYASKTPSEPPPPPTPSQESADFASEWIGLREIIEDLARRTLSGEDPARVEPLIHRFMVDVKEGVASMRRILQRKGELSVTRDRVIAACNFLGVDKPPVGMPADETFRKNAKQMRYEHHPDRLGAAYDEKYFLRIGSALDTLEHYNQTVGGAPNGK